MPTPTQDADEIARELPADIRRTLAVLQGEQDEVVELTLGLCPFGSRALLVAYGVIDPVSRHDQPNDDPVQLELTAFGRQVIYASARSLSEQDKQELSKAQQELDEARTRRDRDQA